VAGWHHAKPRGAELVKRRWVALLLLAFTTPSPAFAAIPIASAIALGLHEGEHVHSLLVIGEDSHRHLVLVHDDECQFSEEREALSHPDHVVELGCSGVASAASRRAAPDLPAAIDPSLAFRLAPAPMSAPRRYTEVPAPPFDPVRTVVLRL
jgi:hypothetical protein